ncbi:MAG: PD-(D/E)XK motif protein [Bacteroidia bacterium]
MDSSTLEIKWSEIGNEVLTDFKSIRIADDCISDLYLGNNSDFKRCLILSIPKGIKIDVIDDIKEYVSLEFFDNSRHLVITLLETNYKELFNDFILSIYNKIKDIQSPETASEQLIEIYQKWCEFFSESSKRKLTTEEIQGLFGELFYLQKLIFNASASTVNEVLGSWTGPEDKGQDFMFPNKTIEVKTKDISQIDVSIGSEFQLQPELGKHLELKVLSVEKYTVKGLSIGQLLLSIKSSINTKQGDISILLKSIGKKGLTLENITEYDNQKFDVRTEVTYNCLEEGFPRLSVSNIPQNVKKIKYSLRLTGLDKYIIESIQF